MLTLVTHVVSRITEAIDKDTLHDAVQSGLIEMDFASYNLSCHKQSKHQFMMEPTLTSWSSQDLTVYDAEQWYERDPLLEYAATGDKPKVWAPQDWHDSPQFGNYAEYLDRVGIRSGVTAPLTNRPGAISAITALSFSRPTLTNDIANAVYVIGHAAMMRAEVLGLVSAIRSYHEADISHLALLSKQQLEILEWASQGKSNEDIASITGGSRRGVAYHMSEILRKLGVSTRTQAVGMLGSNGVPR